ncbi:PAS domain-containing sensor histidine kinase [Clostridium amazonitimonense]|uniref:PAS domain-containing sensor histidine kinase n=1 Tax=Clostridium amazonitimonense TaxID=1499689 RepID=UPI0005096FDA|nr:PAS domain-containing sensor histidine kinase [Clostridium amazonitimonense]
MFNLKYYKLERRYLSILVGIIVNLIITSIFIYSNITHREINIYFVVLLISILVLSLVLQIIALLSMKKIIYIAKENEEIHSQVLESLPTGVLIHRKFKFIFANSLGAKLLNQDSGEDLVGRSLEEFVKLDMAIVGEERMESVLEEKEFKPLIENRLVRSNGDILEVETFSKPIFINKKVAVLNLIKDITEQKKVKELEKRIQEEKDKLKENMEIERLKNEFFANLSHEFRTPLTIILGIIQLMEKDIEGLPEIEQVMANRIKVLKQNCYRLLKLIGNLIDMTKIDAGYFVLDLKNHEIISIIENTTLSIIDYANNKGINIEFDTEVEEKITACDADKIERIMLNLLSNAIKFTRDGGNIRVNVFDENQYIKIVVEDNGIGIPSDKVNMIFDRFVQVDKSFTRNHEGSGIGLSIVKAFVEMHNGNITVESIYGEGSKFTVILPVKILSEDIDNMIVENIGENSLERVNIEFSDI